VEIDEDAAGGYELAYSEAVRALSHQRDAAEALRTRAGMLLSAAAITSSLLGRQAFAGSLSGAGWVAIGSFAALGCLLLAILWPRPEWDSGLSPSRLIATHVESDAAPLPLMHRDLALHMDAAFRENEVSHERSARHFRRAALLLGVEVLALILDLGTGA
jgi:hypothetical protein